MRSSEEVTAGSVGNPDREPGQLTGAVVIVALVSAISGMLYGYDTGIISGRCCRSPRTSASPRAGSR